MTDATAASVRRALAEEGPTPTRTWALLPYDTDTFPFADVLRRDVYRVPDLARLHEYVRESRARRGQRERLTAADNIAVREMMQRLPDGATFYTVYRAFMVHVLTRLVGRGISYSSHPKMRVHFPGTGSVSSFHHDIVVTKRVDQVNVWVPFVDVEGTATIWLESDYGAADYAPVPVRYGEALLFDGGYLGHGTVRNEEDVTRLSMDLRFSYKKASTRAESVALMDAVAGALERRGQRVGRRAA